MDKENSEKISSSSQAQNNTELNKLRLVFEQTPGAIFILDREFRFEFVNPSFERLSGYSQNELIGNTVKDLFYHEEIHESRREVVEAMRRGDKWQGELLTHNKNGFTYWANTIAAPYKNEAGIVEGYIMIQQDITDRKAAELALRESEAKYRELTEMLPLTVFELNADNIPTYINKAGRELFGLNSTNSGNNAMSFFVPNDRDRMKDVLKKENQNAQNLVQNVDPNPSDPAEYTVQKPDGSTIPVLIYGTAILENGKPVGSRGVIVDISERKDMENALRESEEKYKTLIENSQDGIFAIVEDKMLFANNTFCKMVGYTSEELYNKSAVSLVHPDDRERGLAISELRKQGNHSTINDIFRFVAKDGTIKEGDVFSSVLELNGQIVSYITVHDLTELKRAESELKTAKTDLEKLNSQLEKRVKESSKRLTEARTQLINLQKENLQSQFDVLKQQVNPHFLFNSLNVLTSLIKLEPDLAEKFSEQLSKVYRYVLENKDNELVDLNTELNFLDAYIFLLNIRFVGKLTVNLTIPDENRNDKIIPLAMQLLIENAIKHNIMSKMNPLVLDIFIDSNNCLNIINNLQERPSQIVSTGVGLKNILNRYKLLELPIPTFEKTKNHFIARIQLVKSIIPNS
jgi:PAS domain S-box-containing protein